MTEEKTQAKSRVAIDENYCKGCGFCVEFCPKGCIVISKDKVSSQGYLLPVFERPERCTGCGICGIMCPAMSLEVYKIA